MLSTFCDLQENSEDVNHQRTLVPLRRCAFTRCKEWETFLFVSELAGLSCNILLSALDGNINKNILFAEETSAMI